MPFPGNTGPAQTPGSAANASGVSAVTLGPIGFADLPAGVGDFNTYSFLVERAINRMATTTLVRVVAVTPPPPGGAVGRLAVHPMVAQLDGAGRPTPHGVVHDVPFFRLQGGANAVIIDPAVGDIGIAVFASHDVSSVKQNAAPSNPGSGRRYDYADGLYIGGVLNGQARQVIDFGADGLTIRSASRITIDAPEIALTGTRLTHNGVNIGATHTHADPQGGSVGPPR